MTGSRIELAGETVQLHADRALYWERQNALFIADLHLGKAETFQRYGIAVPSETADSDLARLDRLLVSLKPASLWFLGDLTHDADAGFASASDRMTALRRRHPGVAMHLIRGNHDRHLGRLPAAWEIKEHLEGTTWGPFSLRHHPVEKPADEYVLCGHLHPEARIKSGGDALRLRCFVVGSHQCVLPAFADFAGGTLNVPRGDRWVIAGDAVIQV